MKAVLLLPLMLALCLPGTGVADVLAVRGVALAHACAACHGPDGQSQGAIPLNTCYSLVAPDYGISIAGVYRVVDDNITAVEGSEGVSPLDAPDEIRSLEAAYARSWYSNITADVFA